MNNSNYDKYPFVKVKGFANQAFSGYETIGKEINKKVKSLGKNKVVIALDFYAGVFENEVLEAFKKYVSIDYFFYSEDLCHSQEKINNMLERNLTDDRVFGVMSHHTLEEFYDSSLILQIQKQIEDIKEGIILVYGVGASLISLGDILIYADLARWEIQKRYRSKEIGNFRVNNFDEDILRKYKRGFFIEWRVLDRHKKKLFDKIDFLLDTNIKNEPKMITGDAFLEGLKQTVKQPFRVVPYFDPGVWGGQWMKQVCDLDKNKPNFAWCFDCVPEENSLILKYGNILVEIPSIDVVLYQPIPLLGNKVHARFGAEFPIRFDLLDTIDGQNLSLQVHPLTEYIQDQFGMHYTQDESYYLLDAKGDAKVYLGLKDDVTKDELFNDLEKSQKGEILFPADKHINCFKAKKHDHFLIPAGTIHCSGSNCMVLEISATPYIFTFKLWDWGRLGLDGLPRPVHLEHAKEVIAYDRKTNWVKDNLVNRVEVISDNEGCIEERTGLHEREFIETRRHWFSKKVLHKTNDCVNVLNLVEGEEAIIESPNNLFEPFVVHYAETFIIPASVGEYTIAPYGKSIGKEIATIKAYVRV